MQFRLEMDQEEGELKGTIPITIGTLHDDRRKTGGQGKRRSVIPSIINNNGLPMGNNEYEQIGAPEEHDEDDIELQEEQIDAFRHPMAPGEVRQNILFQDFGE